MTKIIGAPLHRREDERLLRGQGQFFDDVLLPGTLHIAVVRNPHARARIRSIDRTAALAIPGVVAIVIAGDYPEFATPMPELFEPGTLKNPYCDFHATAPHYVLPRDESTFQGEPIAMVLAESLNSANDGADAVIVDYEPLPAIISAFDAMANGASQIHPGCPNVVAHLFTSIGNVDEAFARADIVISERLTLQRMASMSIEGRGVVASWDAAQQEMTFWSPNQHPYRLRDTAARLLGIPYNKVRVLSRDVGGTFGGKGLCVEELVAGVMSRRLGRPVKWTETRLEHFFGAHARDQVHDVRVAARHDGTLLALDLKLYKDVGAYNHYEMVPSTNTVNHVLSHFKVPAFRAEGWCVLTNKVPSRPSRGAGRPEASFVMDRVLDFVAREARLDPLEVRLRNVIRPEEMPYRNGLTYRDNVPICYDGGDYLGMLKKAAERAQYTEWRARQREGRKTGRLIGIGISSYLEAGGIGPCEGATVTVDDAGRVSVFVGVNTHGQGHETTFAQVCADQLGARFEDVTVYGGDTALMRHGYGTGASRIGVSTGNAVAKAAIALRKKIGELASRVFEAALEDIVIEDGRAYIAGVDKHSRSFADLARVAFADPRMEDLGGPGLTATEYFYPETVTWSSGVHIAVVELDAATGEVGVVQYAIVHDSGQPLNVTVVDGQIQGGTAMGLGAALGEELVYAPDGQLLTGSFMDYPMPRASDIPPFNIEHCVYPTPRNPLGMRSVGESGPISVPAAIAGAVEDALEGCVRIVRMPLTPLRVYGLLQEHERLSNERSNDAKQVRA